jgi:hypothetical protein
VQLTSATPPSNPSWPPRMIQRSAPSTSWPPRSASGLRWSGSATQVISQRLHLKPTRTAVRSDATAESERQANGRRPWLCDAIDSRHPRDSRPDCEPLVRPQPTPRLARCLLSRLPSPPQSHAAALVLLRRRFGLYGRPAPHSLRWQPIRPGRQTGLASGQTAGGRRPGKAWRPLAAAARSAPLRSCLSAVASMPLAPSPHTAAPAGGGGGRRVLSPPPPPIALTAVAAGRQLPAELGRRADRRCHELVTGSRGLTRRPSPFSLSQDRLAHRPLKPPPRAALGPLRHFQAATGRRGLTRRPSAPEAQERRPGPPTHTSQTQAQAHASSPVLKFSTQASNERSQGNPAAIPNSR